MSVPIQQSVSVRDTSSPMEEVAKKIQLGARDRVTRSRLAAAVLRLTSRVRKIDFRPSRIGIEGLNFSRQLVGLRTKILLKHGAILVDNKGHDAGIAILSRVSHEREAADHLAFGQIVVSAARRIRPLAG